MSQLFLINVSGKDQPGITAALSRILAEKNARVLDIGQAVIHNSLSLGLLAEVPKADSLRLLEQINQMADRTGLLIDVDPIADDEYERWVNEQEKKRHILTLLGRRITARHIANTTELVASFGLNIDKINRLSGRVDLNANLNESMACVEFSLRGETADPMAFRSACLSLGNEMNVDIAYQQDDLFRRYRRLVVFDMDSTLIEAEVIDELAKEAGVGEQVSEITEQAMRGELDFKQSFRRRVALLQGLDEAVLEKVAARLKLTEGAELLISTLRSLGYKTAILSGGFQYFAEKLRRQLGIDYVFANELEIIDGQVTGKVTGDIVDGDRKAHLLKEIAHREGVRLEQVVAVGDGANDLLMLSIAGLGIAFRAKPIVRQSARQSLSNVGLDGILYLIGCRDRDKKLLASNIQVD